MPIQTNLNVAPYYDDYNETKDFYKILFRPGVAVQARELNQMQSILQKQIERFGDNIFKQGTIIDGCNINFHPKLPYVKIKDVQTDGAPVNVSEFINLYIKNNANLHAYVVTTIGGFESRNPDLNTMYVRYLNSGDSNDSTAFAADQVLTVFDRDNVVFKVNVQDGSSGFAKADKVHFVSALAVQNSSGGVTFANSFHVGDRIYNGGSANAVIVGVDTTTNSEAVILKIRPYANNLAVGNTALWTFSPNDSIICVNTTAGNSSANVVNVIGSGAAATIATDSVGQIDYVAVTSRGNGYYIAPTVWVSSSVASTLQIAAANLVPQMYLTQLTVANTITSPVGFGYGVTVDEGVIYQKGFFSRVSKQLAVVEKYFNADNNLPDDAVVGFDTTEEIINSNIDQTLLDNATGTPNAVAPGANRLKLSPTLTVLDKATADANSEFFPIVAFSEGYPYKQNRQTQYNIIGDEMAKRTYDESGNYVLDQFILTTKSTDDIADDPTYFRGNIDPGKAYINGYKVETLYNYEMNIPKGTDTQSVNNATVTMTYGNYITVKELGGQFNFAQGNLSIDLYDTAKGYITNAGGSAITPTGTKIGTAKMYSVVSNAGVPGTAAATYNMYIFDIDMNPGTNFKNVKSVYFNGTNKGIADVVQSIDAATNTPMTFIKDNKAKRMLFSSGAAALKNANNITYTYRTTANAVAANTQGKLSISLTDETFPYSTTLSTANRSEILVVPLANCQATVNASGSVTTATNSVTVTGTSTQFLTNFAAGDFVVFKQGATTSAPKQIASIANDTSMTMTSNVGTLFAGTGNAYVYFPQNVPIDMSKSGRSATLSANLSVITLNIGTAINVQTSCAVTYNARVANAQPQTKTVHRNSYVRLVLANNSGGIDGPWSLGLPDVFRLKGVYKYSNNTFTETGAGVVDVTSDFYINHMNDGTSSGISRLTRSGSKTAITASDVLLVKFDNFTTSADGLRTVTSYLPTGIDNDDNTLAASTTTINTMEIPEIHTAQDETYDLRDCFDFRPTKANTVAIATSAATAPINPTGSTTYVSGDKKFPIPNSDLNCNLEYFVGRVDRVVVTADNEFKLVKGTPGQYVAPPAPSDSLTISQIVVPPYPSIPQALTNEIAKIVDTKVGNEKVSLSRRSKYAVTLQTTANDRSRLQPRGYSMQDIGDLERRIRDLEYYVSFTLAEAEVKARTIPGLGGIDRFKFGFVVDMFNDYSYSDLNNPEYTATIVNGRLAAKVNEIVIEHKPTANTPTTFPSIEVVIASQTNATDGPMPVVVPPVVTPTPNTTPTVTPTTNTVVTVANTVTVTQTTLKQLVLAANRNCATDCSVYEEKEFKFSSLSGVATVYFNFEDVLGAVEIFYGTSPGFSTAGLTPKVTSSSAVAITATEATDFSKAEASAIAPGLTQTVYNAGTYGTAILAGTYGKDAGYYVSEIGYAMARNPTPRKVTICGGKVGIDYSAFKLTWNHNPAWGEYVKIRVYKYSKDDELENEQTFFKQNFFTYWIHYPSDSTNTTTNVASNTVSSPNQFSFSGIIGGVSPSTFTINTAYINQSYSTPTYNLYPTPRLGGDNQVFTIGPVRGLKPGTAHKFYFDGKDMTAKCKDIVNTTAAQGTLVSNIYGLLTFQFYYDAGIDEATSNFTEQNRLQNLATGNKAISVENSDGSSKATGTIEIKSYMANVAIATAITTPANTTTITVPNSTAAVTPVPSTKFNWANIIANVKLP